MQDLQNINIKIAQNETKCKQDLFINFNNRKLHKEILKECKIIKKDIKTYKENNKNVNIKELSKRNNNCKKPILLYNLNIVNNIVIYFLLIVFWISSILAKNNYLMFFMLIILFLGCFTINLILKIIYYSWYSIHVKPKDNHKKVLSIMSKIIELMIIISFAYFIITIYYSLNIYVCVVPLSIVLFLNVIKSIYRLLSYIDMTSKYSSIFNLFLSIIIVISITFSKIENPIYVFIIKILLFIICLIMTGMIFKYGLFDKKLLDIKSIIYFIIIIVVTIGLTTYTIYLFLWNKNSSEQILYSSVMGIYASIIGSVITLSGVAWSLRKNEEDRKKEFDLSIKPYFAVSTLSSTDSPQKIIFVKEDFTRPSGFNNKFDFGYIRNSSKIEFSIESIYLDNRKYIPLLGAFIKKEGLFYISISEKEEIDIKKIYMVVNDVNQNKYKYKIILNEDVTRIKDIIEINEEK